IAREGRAVETGDVAEHAGRRRLVPQPRQQLERVGIGLQERVALLHAREPVDGRTVEAHALGEGVLELGRRDGHRLGHAEDVGEPEEDEPHPSLLDRPQHIVLLALHPPIFAGDSRSTSQFTERSRSGQDIAIEGRLACPSLDRRRCEEGAVQQRTPAEVVRLVQDEGVEIVNFRFCDLPGLMQHFSSPAHELTEEGFEDGYGFDGSSIRGFQELQESDMLLIPDPNTCVIDPFRQHPTLNINCFVRDPVTGESYTRDPRYVAKKAEDYLRGTGLADTAYFGPEAEFYIFDSVRFDQNQNSSYHYVDSIEGAWNTGREEEGGNLGYKPRYKEGYFPTSPMDHYQDLRSEMVRQLEKVGIEIEVQHHEVGTAGQAEIDMRFDSMLRMAAKAMLYKYVVKNVALAAGKTETFMPTPIFQDNGSGMHVHQSLWKGGQPLSFHEPGYAGLSQLARWYIGGLLKH